MMELAKFFWKEKTFWSDGYFSCSIGNVSKETIEKAFTYTIVDVLSKPFNEMNVRRVITSMENFK